MDTLGLTYTIAVPEAPIECLKEQVRLFNKQGIHFYYDVKDRERRLEIEVPEIHTFHSEGRSAAGVWYNHQTAPCVRLDSITAIYNNAVIPRPKNMYGCGKHCPYRHGNWKMFPQSPAPCVVHCHPDPEVVKVTMKVRHGMLFQSSTENFELATDRIERKILQTRAARELIKALRSGDKRLERQAKEDLFHLIGENL